MALIPTILSTPGIPASISATPGNASVTISWGLPVSDGGSPIITYNIQVSYFDFVTMQYTSVNSMSVQATHLGATIDGLTNGQPYNITVIAVNAVGPSDATMLSVVPGGTGVVTPPAHPTLASTPRSGAAGTPVTVIPMGAASNNLFTTWKQSTTGLVTLTSAIAQLSATATAPVDISDGVVYIDADVMVNFSSDLGGAGTAALLSLDDGVSTSIKVTRHYDSATGSNTFQCVAMVLGTTICSTTLVARSATGSLRIVAANGYVYALSKDGADTTWSIVGSASGWPTNNQALTAHLGITPSSGTITTSFTGFTSAFGIMFGTQPVLDLVDMHTCYQVNAPAGAGVVDITLFNEAGVIAQSLAGFTYA